MSDLVWSSVIQAVSAIAAAAIAGWVTVMLARIAVLKSQRETYRSIARDQDRIIVAAVEDKLTKEGKPVPPPLAAVEPEHQSPVTEFEAIAAEQATLRARVTAAALLLGVPPREDPPELAAADAAGPGGGATTGDAAKTTIDAAAKTVEAASATVEAAAKLVDRADADKREGGP